MTLSKPRIFKYIIIAIIAVLITSLWPKRKINPKSHPRDFSEIISDGTLRAITEYNAVSYFVDKDTVSGFYYELIQAFAQSQGLKVEVVPEMSFEKRLQDLKSGACDIIAYGIPITTALQDSILFSIPIIRNKQVLVQRKADNDNDTAFVQSQLQLAQKTLHIVKGSSSLLRIRNLSNEIGDTIHVREVEKYGQEQLMAMVAHGDINYAVVDENIALAAIDSFPQLDIHTGISFTQLYAWGMNKKAPALKDSVDVWLTDYMKSKAFKKLSSKYF